MDDLRRSRAAERLAVEGVLVQPRSAGPSGRQMDSPATPAGSLPANQWVFLAVRLIDGGVGRGELTIRVNAQACRFSHQAVHMELPSPRSAPARDLQAPKLTARAAA